mmetsp:Transcript_16850/g.19405  ORF Transcript_16850/g.19405 Transcript_16850/m.19405 type:complete len:402 (-) Transcript_16850:381-1586(-)
MNSNEEDSDHATFQTTMETSFDTAQTAASNALHPLHDKYSEIPDVKRNGDVAAAAGQSNDPNVYLENLSFLSAPGPPPVNAPPTPPPTMSVADSLDMLEDDSSVSFGKMAMMGGTSTGAETNALGFVSYKTNQPNKTNGDEMVVASSNNNNVKAPKPRIKKKNVIQAASTTTSEAYKKWTSSGSKYQGATNQTKASLREVSEKPVIVSYQREDEPIHSQRHMSNSQIDSITFKLRLLNVTLSAVALSKLIWSILEHLFFGDFFKFVMAGYLLLGTQLLCWYEMNFFPVLANFIQDNFGIIRNPFGRVFFLSMLSTICYEIDCYLLGIGFLVDAILTFYIAYKYPGYVCGNNGKISSQVITETKNSWASTEYMKHATTSEEAQSLLVRGAAASASYGAKFNL